MCEFVCPAQSLWFIVMMPDWVSQNIYHRLLHRPASFKISLKPMHRMDCFKLFINMPGLLNHPINHSINY